MRVVNTQLMSNPWNWVNVGIIMLIMTYGLAALFKVAGNQSANQ